MGISSKRLFKMIGKQPKGKPKTKIKSKKRLVDTLISLSGSGSGDHYNCECYDPRTEQVVVSKQYEQVKASRRTIEKQDHFSESNNNNNSNSVETNNPLISINLATTSNSFQQKTTTSISRTNQLELDGKAPLSSGERQSITGLRSNNNNSYNNTNSYQEIDSSEAAIYCNVDEVKRNFITLVRYNKLQYFFLGTLIYSVMNICFIFYALLEMPNDIPSSSNYHDNKSNYINSNSNGVVADADDDNVIGMITRSNVEQNRKINYILNNELNLLEFVCLFGQSTWMVPFSRSAAKFLLTIKLPAIFILALVAALTTLQFGFNDTATKNGETSLSSTTKNTTEENIEISHLATSSSNSRLNKKDSSKIKYLMSRAELPLQSFGLILALILLYLPFISSNLSSIYFLISNYIGNSDVSEENSSFSKFQESSTSSYFHPSQFNETISNNNTLPVSFRSNSNSDAATIFDHYSLIVLLMRLPMPPISPLLALIYLQPLLFEGTSLNAKFVSTFTILPLFILAFARFWLAHYTLPQILSSSSPSPSSISITSNSRCNIVISKQPIEATKSNQPLQLLILERHLVISESIISSVSLTCLLLIIILGLLKRRYFVKIVNKDTFTRASQLIEAKVSLEHQRQQQETLLLSVLPAYVAEQVKRNMLKKTTTSGCTISNNLDFQPSAQDYTTTTTTTMTTTNYNLTHCQPTTNNSTLPSQGGSTYLLALTTNNNNDTPTRSSTALFSSSIACSVHNSSTNINAEQSTSQHQAYSIATPKRKLSDDHHSGGGPVKLVQSALISALSSNSKRSTTKLNLSNLANTSLLSENFIGGLTNTSKDLSSPKHSSSQIVPSIQHQPFLHQPTPPVNLSSPGGNQSRRGFNELYIRTYNNVSLLYGDIVGFTRLCTQLSSSQLVRVLNDLFSHFDLLAEKHKIMRIKILGDCYYGVSGIPEFAVMGAKSRAGRNDNHAINCVNMGLDMIHYIKCLNVERASMSEKTISHSISSCMETNKNIGSNSHDFPSKSNLLQDSHKAGSIEDGGNHSSCCHNNADNNLHKTSTDSSQSKLTGSLTPLPAFELNMRIGVHSGHIHSGVIGLKKWQFDVWSNDVSIAMHCESSGIAGRVQVTEATIQQLNGAFTFEKALGSQRDSFLASKDISTYLIRDRVQTSLSPYTDVDAKTLANEKIVLAKKKKQQWQQQQQERRQQQVGDNSSSNIQDEDNIRAATIGTIKQTLLAGDTCNASGSNSYGLAINHHDITPLLLNYQDSTISKLYSQRRIDNLVQEIISLILLLIIFLPLISFRLLNPTTQFDWHHIIIIATCLLIFVNFLPQSDSFNQNINSKEDLDSSLTSLLKEESSSSGNKTTSLRGNHQCDKLSKNQINQKGQEGNDYGGGNLSHIAIYIGWIKKKMGCFYYELRDFAQNQLMKILLMEIKKSRLRSMIVLSLFMTVILIQCYLILFNENNCKSISNSVDVATHRIVIDSQTTSPSNHKLIGSQDFNSYQHVVASEQYYLAVILLLISVELSVNLLSYKAKCIIIMSIICLHFLFILKPILMLQEDDRDCRQVKKLTNNSNANINIDDSDRNREKYYNDRYKQDSNSLELITNEQVISWSSNALLFVMALWSLAFARQLEYTKKTNFLWRNRLNVDHEELEYISGINKVLLENILPSHVVQYYLTNPNNQGAQNQLPSLRPYMRMSFSNMRTINNELYHEQHDSVAVMFASIPHFYEFYDESDISKQGLGCIALLNEIICDFDKLLLKNKFSRIEKIKTIGSTYMAAAGLRPCNLGSRSSNASQQAALRSNSPTTSRSLQQQQQQRQQTSEVEQNVNSLTATSNSDKADERKLVMSQEKLNLICMIQFATSLMTALNGINKQSFQVFKLRVGVNTGQVIAGVIGAQRPFYDIWGDCVNIASRMESLGEVGRIQVEEKTAKLLTESLCADTYSIVCRGPIDVKGKGGMVTYFVDKKVTGDEQHYRVDRASSNDKPGTSGITRSIASDKSKLRKPSEPECEVRVTVTGDCDQPQIRRKSLDPTC